jgi:uncharacterized membrane protein
LNQYSDVLGVAPHQFQPRFRRHLTLLSAIVTSLLVVPILCWQVTTWIVTGEWSPFPISRALALAGFDHQAIYVIAEFSEHSDVSSPDNHGNFSWLVDFPTIGILLIVAAILMIFRISAASIQQNLRQSKNRD